MCCLFGLIDCQNNLTAKQKNDLLLSLATAAEARGTDATGIAYNDGGKLRVYKRPWAGRYMRFCVPKDACAVMGHTRFATQGSAKRNYNNHPFCGEAGGLPFALAHNGVIHNDNALRKGLPKTKIKTDSYVAVQLIEQNGVLNLNSLKNMAEQIWGSFTFTLLDQRDRLYFVKGNSPLCIYHFPGTSLYVYASTKEILLDAKSRLNWFYGKPEPIFLKEGDILKLRPDGTFLLDKFRMPLPPDPAFWEWPRWFFDWEYENCCNPHLEALKAVAPSLGYTPEAIEILFNRGYSPEEIEDVLYGVRP